LDPATRSAGVRFKAASPRSAAVGTPPIALMTLLDDVRVSGPSLPCSRSGPAVKGGPPGPSEASREAAPLTARTEARSERPATPTRPSRAEHRGRAERSVAAGAASATRRDEPRVRAVLVRRGDARRPRVRGPNRHGLGLLRVRSWPAHGPAPAGRSLREEKVPGEISGRRPVTHRRDKPRDTRSGVSSHLAGCRPWCERAAPVPQRCGGVLLPARRPVRARAYVRDWSAAVRRPLPCRGRNAGGRAEPGLADRQDASWTWLRV
jgi:hypothetical protein